MHRTRIWPWPPAGCLLKLPVAGWVWFAWACSPQQARFAPGLQPLELLEGGCRYSTLCRGYLSLPLQCSPPRLLIKVIGPRLHPFVSSIHESDTQTRATCVPQPIPPSIVHPSIHSIPSTGTYSGTYSGTSRNPAKAHHRPAAPRCSVTDSPKKKNQKHTALFQGTANSTH